MNQPIFSEIVFLKLLISASKECIEKKKYEYIVYQGWEKEEVVSYTALEIHQIINN